MSFALVGLSARARAQSTPPDGATPPLSASAGTAVAAVCLTAVVLIVLYGLGVVTGLL